MPIKDDAGPAYTQHRKETKNAYTNGRIHQKTLKALIRGCLAAAAISVAAPASAELFEGCPSKPILGKFIEFGKSAKMPKDLGKWLNTPSAQKVDPWKPFDNVDYVSICWVSAWLVHTDDGVVLIDTLYGPFVDLLVENIAAVGVNMADIKYVLMTHGHFDHPGGVARLKPMLPNAKFVMTQRGWDEGIASAAKSKGRRKWEMLSQDVVVADGDTIELGGNVFQVIETPGHTWGTASFSYDVKDGNNVHRAVTIVSIRRGPRLSCLDVFRCGFPVPR